MPEAARNQPEKNDPGQQRKQPSAPSHPEPEPIVEKAAQPQTPASPAMGQTSDRIDQPTVMPEHPPPYRRPPLLEMLETVFRRHELARLRAENETLTKRTGQLHKQLKEKDRVFHAYYRRECTNRQVLDLWISSSPQKARETLVADYAQSEQPILTGRVMVVPDGATAAKCNQLGQENRRDSDTFDPTLGMAHDRVLLHNGDRVHFLRSDEQLGVEQGDLGEIIRVYPEHRTLAVALDRREMELSELIFVPLQEYRDIDLGYAVTYREAERIEFEVAFVLAQLQSPTRELVDRLPCHCVNIYADKLTAAVQFPELARDVSMTPSVDLEADPLAEYRQRR